MKNKDKNKIKLLDILPNIKSIIGKTIVIKCGGSVLTESSFLKNVIQDISLLYSLGCQVVVVHGGGPEISDMCLRLDIPNSFHNGQRITNKETMVIVQMVLHGKINRSLVTAFKQLNVNAVGLSGHDSSLISASKFNEKLGFVGKIENINISFLHFLLSGKYLPVISSIGVDSNGNSYNINADIAAGEIAGALKANILIVLSDVNGIYENKDEEKSRISIIKSSEIKKQLEEQKYSDGMIPKIDGCLSALNKGVDYAHILSGKMSYSLLRGVLINQDIGTKITLDAF